MTSTARWICVISLMLFAAQSRGADISQHPLIRIGGFTDIEWHTTSENEREGLDLAEFDVFGTVEFSNAWSALAETVVQQNWRRNDNSTDADLERLYVERSTSDAFRLEIGKTQTGIVRWNEREHRSRFLQTPIDVPAIARRPHEDGAWPMQFLGVFASGRLPGSLGVTWGAGAGAGPGQDRDSIPPLGRHRSPAALLSLSIAPDSLPGLDVGAAAYAQNVHGEPEHIQERDFTFSANYVNSGTEIHTEWARMHHRDLTRAMTFLSTGYYALFSKRLSGSAERVRPYLLLDRLNVANGESYLAEASDENAWAAGVRYDITRRLTIKGEYRSQRAASGDRETVIGVQFGMSF